MHSYPFSPFVTENLPVEKMSCQLNPLPGVFWVIQEQQLKVIVHLPAQSLVCDSVFSPSPLGCEAKRMQGNNSGNYHPYSYGFICK